MTISSKSIEDARAHPLPHDGHAGWDRLEAAIEAAPAHMPGPWRVSADSDGVIEVSAGDMPIARAVAQGGRMNLANAKLVAAAPELLRALQDLCEEAWKLRSKNVRKDFSLLNAHACAIKAINKATA